ncbi:response regulator FixJ [Poriferisphaera sp. WC338]|uniref:response regulator FixJ n=1 Tax=Poriferisphaera sp. WC338 TaxID=3425129 RepID=UPI003D8191AE
MNENPTVYVVDDDKAVRDSLKWLIESVGLQVKTYETAMEFLSDCEGMSAGALVVDVRLPGMSGLDLQDQLKKRGIRLPVIIITGHGDVPVAIRAMKAGALDFIEKPFSDQVLLDRIRDALEADAERRESQMQRGEVESRLKRLTPRERQVMDLVVQGRLNKQIAAELDLSHKTIEVHRAHVMEKMNAGSLAELVRMAVVIERTEPKATTSAPSSS